MNEAIHVFDLTADRSLVVLGSGQRLIVPIPIGVLEPWIHSPRSDEQSSGNPILDKLRRLLPQRTDRREPMNCIGLRRVGVAGPGTLVRDLGGRLQRHIADVDLQFIELTSAAQIPTIAEAQIDALIAISLSPKPALYGALADIAEKSGLPWIPLIFEAGTFVLGPAVAVRHDVDYRDALTRQRLAARDVAAWQTLQDRWTDHMTQSAMTSAEQSAALDRAVVELTRWLESPETSSLRGAQLVLDLDQLAPRHHPVLPRPDRTKFPAVVSEQTPVVDSRHGIVTRVRKISQQDYMPRRLATVVADVSQMSRHYTWLNDHQAFGQAWDSEAVATNAAVGEAIERYCCKWISPNRQRIFASYREFPAAAGTAIAPEALPLYSESMYADTTFPYVPFTPESPVHWVYGERLRDGSKVWVPAFATYVQWQTQHSSAERRHVFPVIAGTASGRTIESATLSALLEVIERDATMIWWSNRHQAPAMIADRDIDALTSDVADQYETSLFHLTSDIDVPVMGALVRSRAKGYVTTGFAARGSVGAAARKALAEAYALQLTCHVLDDEQRMARRSERDVGLEQIKPWRSDRLYMDSYASDYRDVRSLTCQQQFHLDPRAVRSVESWLKPAAPTLAVDNQHECPENLHAVVDRVLAAGFDPIRVDLTTPDLEGTHHRVVRVLVPGLISNYPAAYPLLGNHRLMNLPRQLGWQTSAKRMSDLNLYPLPHA